MLKHNDRCTGFDYKGETLSYLALEGWYNIDCAKLFNLLSATDKQRSTHRVHLLRLQTIEDDPIIHPVSQQVYHLRETHLRGVCRSIKLTSLRDAVRGSLLIAVMIHVIQASTLDYHSEVDTISH